jgi:hypothetical protein
MTATAPTRPLLTLKAVAAWLLILVFAVLNGAFREAVLLPNIPRPGAFVLSGTLLSSCIVAVALLLAGWLRLDLPSRPFAVGSLWFCLTLAFEFGFGRLVDGLSWAEILEAYTFKEGNIWPLVLLVTFMAPFIAARIRGKAPAERGRV